MQSELELFINNIVKQVFINEEMTREKESLRLRILTIDTTNFILCIKHCIVTAPFTILNDVGMILFSNIETKNFDNNDIIDNTTHRKIDQSEIVPEKVSSKNETVPLVADPSELGLFLSRSYISKEEFVKEYRKLYYRKAEAKKMYLQVLKRLEKTISEGNIDSFKKLSNYIYYISDVENQKTLTNYYNNVNNPINTTNIVILACKYNKVNIVKYLFDSDSRILNNLSIDVRRTTILPDDDDDTLHNAFYYAIRSGNIGLLDTLINKWPDNYFVNNSEKLDEILSRTYEELKLKNVPLSDEMEIFVENKLINLRFFSNSFGEDQRFRGDLKCIRERIALILENISLLKSRMEEVDEKFLFVAKFIAQNIHILKQQLKCTYDRLPWEEIEFCLVCFISSYTKQQEINIFYRITLNKSKILTHLENFAKILEVEKESLNGANIGKLAGLPKSNREDIVARIIRNYSQFEELYNDYQQIRDLHSLEKINDCIILALSTDPKERKGRLIIIRVLQVIGEHLKNTLDSPKLSVTISELFLLSLPSYTRKVIVDLRNSLSHSNSLLKRTEIEEKIDVNFFINVQNDIKKVGDVVTDILYNKKFKTIRILLKKLVNSESLIEIKEVAEIFNNVELDKLMSDNFKLVKHQKLEKLIKKLGDTITYKTNYEKELLNKINNILNCIGSLSENSKTDYFTGCSYLKVLCTVLYNHKDDENNIKVIKFGANQTLKNITYKIEPRSLKEIAKLSTKLFQSVISRIQYGNLQEIKRLIIEIFFIAEFETDDIKWIEELRNKLKERHSFISSNKPRMIHNTTEETYKKQFELKVSELKNILDDHLLSGQSTEKIYSYKCKKMQAVVEMLVLDIMSILGSSKYYLENNHLFLDDHTPLLTGKCLRNHLAHDNSLTGILMTNSSIAVILNAKKLTEENIMSSKKTLGKLVNDDPSKLRKKYDQGLATITNQKIMFIALEEGQLEALKDCLNKGADINARSINLWTTLHFAAKGPSLEVVKFILDQDVSVNVRDMNCQTPLHIAAAHGRKNIVEFFVKEAGLNVDDQDKIHKTPLHIAAQNGHKETVEVLLQYKANTMNQDFCGLSPLHYAISNNHINVAKILLGKEANVDINETSGGYTALHGAAERGNLEIVNFLLENKADVNARNDRDWTALHAAALNGHLEVVNALILKGSNVNARVLNGCSPLHYAVENGHEEIANILLKHGTNVNAIDKTYNNTPLHYAAKDGHEAIVKILLKYQANANVVTVEGTTPLHLAVKYNQLKIVTVLLKNSANMHVQDKHSHTPLHYAAVTGNKKVAELLIKSGADISTKTNDNLTLIHLAAIQGHGNIIDLLIKNNALVNAKDVDGRTPLHVAAMNDTKDIIGLLIKNKAEVNTRANDNTTPLCTAAINGHGDIVALLIKNKAEVNPTTNYSISPLHAAVAGGHKDIVEILIKNKAQIDARGTVDTTPLYVAVTKGRKEIVEILVANGANVNIKSNNQTPLLSAIKHNHKEIVEVLIANGADINADAGEPLLLAAIAGCRHIVDSLLKSKARVDVKSIDNATPLHLAATRGHKDIVNSLITNGANVDAVTINNTTPLHFAAQEGHEEVVEILVANGANVNAVYIEGTPLHLAAGSGHNNVVEILLNNRAKINDKDKKKRTPLELAAGNGHMQVVQTLLQYRDIDINAKGNDDWTVLHIAAQKKNLEIVRYLVNKGSDIHAKNSSGSKPIHIAAREGNKDSVEFFLSNGSSINDLGAVSQTLLHYAAIKGQLEVAKYLIAQGADVNVKDANGQNPVHIAANFGYKDVIIILLESGAVYNASDKFYRKPLEIAKDKEVINLLASTQKLFKAVKHNSISEVEDSIQAGAFVGANNADNATPLHYAAWKGYDGVVNVLLQNNATPNVIGNKGLTPLHYAAKYSHLKVVKALLSNGAVYNAISCVGKTPSDFSVDTNITYLFQLVSESFNNIKNDNSQVINKLNKIKDIDTIKAIMRARNRENQTLVVAAMHSKFSKVEQLKQISQGDVSVQIDEASMFFNQGNYQQALSIFKSVFEKRKEILGLDNPGTLDIQTYIAGALYKQGTYQKALNTYEEIYQKQKKMLGLNHTDTLSTRSTIALVLHRQGKDEDAFQIYQEVCQTQMELLGPNHWDTLNSQFHMALVLDRQGKYEEALEINRAVFEKRRELLGANHPVTVSAQNNIAMVLGNQGKYEESLHIYRDVVEKKKMILGIKHADTLRTMHNIAGILGNQKKYYEALKAQEEVLNIQKKFLGSNHPDTLNTQYNMANILFIQGKWIAALKGYKECFDKQKAIFGQSHPVITDILKKLETFKKIFKLQGYEPSEILQYLQKDINIAASKGEIQTIQRLLKDGVDVNDKDIDGRTPLHYAVDNGQKGVVNFLLKNGADVTEVTNKGNTPLHTATSKGYKEIVEVLLQHVSHNKVNEFINTKTTASGATALHVAAKNGSLDVIKSLLKRGAIYNIKNNKGNTPLDLSEDQNVINLLNLVEELFRDAKNGNVEIISKFKAVKSDEFVSITNARNNQEVTLLTVALTNKHKNIARQLLEILKK